MALAEQGDAFVEAIGQQLAPSQRKAIDSEHRSLFNSPSLCAHAQQKS